MLPKNQVYWWCRRGLLELDLLFNTFFKQHYDQLSLAQQEAFQQLLALEDQCLQAWFFHSVECDHDQLREIVCLIKQQALMQS